MDTLAAAGFGVLGGALAELLKWWRIRHVLHNGMPKWARSWGYWIVTALMALTGGLLAFLYASSDVEMTPILAVNLGITAPLFLQSLAQAAPPPDPGPVN